MSTRNQSYLLVLLATVTAMAVAVMFAPWLRTGSAVRNSFEVVQAADRLDVLPGGPQAVISVVWAFLPLVAVLAVLALTVDRVPVAVVLTVVVGLVQAGFGAVVTNAPRSADWGATAGLALGLTLAVVALATAWITRDAT